MDCNNPPPPGDGTPGELNETGHLFPGGPSYPGSYDGMMPPRFWGPPPPSYLGIGPSPFSFPPPFQCGPPIFTVPPPTHLSHTTSSDKIWLDNWLQSRSQQQDRKAVQGVSLVEGKESLRKWMQCLEKLEQNHSNLQNEVETLSDSEWNAMWVNIEQTKSDASEMSSYFCGELITDLKKKICKRAMKRLRLKRQKAARKKDAYLAQLRRQSLHRKADAWLADMQLAVDRARNDEELKKEADCVLANVTRRQTEGRRQIALLEALQKLHQARIQTIESRGSRLSSEDRENAAHSTLAFDRLLNLWSRKMEEYNKEETDLRVMLKESAAKQSDLEIENVCHILEEWETFLFGSEISSREFYDTDTLISIRYAWDQYLVPDGAASAVASAIPVGWVLPTTPSSTEWQQLLSK
ncbi:hypothetical protein ONE63_008787 [Megalurothrips usitatus]|uniref:Programmed cell death protein 7-like n=1 Tax=Megalurothrips usitatus TaxID=439358 RepID=A0AAV7XRI1_9NEOP|nr:hypothetical protein ONE63_008787 [Megalurothrips usitatus]